MSTKLQENFVVDGHRVVSNQEWIGLRTELLKKEKELTRARDAVNRDRLALPWTLVDKTYVFEGPKGNVSLADLFDGRSQLIVYHFMYAPGWEEGCSGCSFLCDHIDGALPHLQNHDVSVVAISRATLPEIETFKKRMRWGFPWVSSHDSDFNYDFGVSYTREDLDRGGVFHNFSMQKLRGEEQPGISAFYKDSTGAVYRTYSSYERGGDLLIGTYNYLDLAPKGRNEQGNMGDWMKLHDLYDAKAPVELEPPRFVESKPMLLAGVERGYRGDEIGRIPEQWSKFAPLIGTIPGQIGRVAYGVCSHPFRGDECVRYMTAVEVSDLTALPDEFGAVRLPAQLYAVFAHRGHVATLSATIDAIVAHWLPKSGFQASRTSALLERYGEDFSPTSPIGGVEVWVPVVK